MTKLTSDPAADAAIRMAATPLVAVPTIRANPEPLDLPPAPKRAEPTCEEGGPHRYPPRVTDPACSVCGVTPADAACAGLARTAAEAKLRGAFA